MEIYCAIVHNRTKNRWLYEDRMGRLYLDCNHCGITSVDNFGNDHKGFYGKRAECTPCRRRTKENRDKIGTRNVLDVAGVPLEVTYFKVSQAGRFAYLDHLDNIYFTCTVCKLNKHTDEFYNETGGLLDKKSKCKSCTDEVNREYDKTNEEYLKLKSKEWYEKNRDEIRKKAKKFRDENEQHIYLQSKRHRERYREQIYFKKKEYRKLNKDKEKKRIKKWFDNNPHKQRYYSQLRLARQKSLPDSLTEQQLLKILERYDYKCCLSGEEAHLDHVIPLFIGHGGTTYENIIPVSRVLNGSKQDKNIFEWVNLVYKDFGFSLERFNTVMTEVAARNNMTLDEYKQFYYWCFDNPRDDAKKILKRREKEKEEYLINIEKAVKLYVGGVAIKKIEKTTRISNTTIYKQLKIRGIKCDRRLN